VTPRVPRSVGRLPHTSICWEHKEAGIPVYSLLLFLFRRPHQASSRLQTKATSPLPEYKRLLLIHPRSLQPALTRAPRTTTRPTPTSIFPESTMSAQTTMGDLRKTTVPTGFLSLNPVTSSNAPQAPKTQDQPQPIQRRSSSMDSDGKPTIKILKLGPVHLGEHPDEHKEDWHEVAVE
jgi:hypothetical protein